MSAHATRLARASLWALPARPQRKVDAAVQKTVSGSVCCGGAVAGGACGVGRRRLVSFPRLGQPQTLERHGVDRNDDARAGRGDRSHFGSQAEPDGLEDACAIGRASELYPTAEARFWCILRLVPRLIEIAQPTSSGPSG